MDPAYSITSEPEQPKEETTGEKIRRLFGEAQGYMATAADTGLLGAPSFVARKLGVGDALERLKALNPEKYKKSAEWAGNLASMALPTGIPSRLAAGTAKLGAKVFPKAAPALTSKAAQILAQSESLAKLRGLRGMATRGAVNAAWTAAPREAMSENPEWGNVPLEAATGAIMGPVAGKVGELATEKLTAAKINSIIKNILQKDNYFNYSDYGMRYLPQRGRKYKIGEKLKPSYRWVDGERTREKLEGTSAIELRSEEDINNILKYLRQSSNPEMPTYFGDEIALIRGINKGGGEDPGESLLKDAEIMGIFPVKDFLEAFKDIK